MELKEIKELLESVFNCMISAKEDNSNNHMDFEQWEWPVGVGLYGLYKYYKLTDEKKYLDFIIDWYDRHIEAGLPPKNVNSVAPLLTLAHVYEITKNNKYLEVCNEWAQWIMKEMPRTEEDGLQHITIVSDNKEQLWDDTLFMTVLFLSKMAVLTNNSDYSEEAEFQFLQHIKYLYDTETGLWFHGWSFEGRHNFGKVLWARGNCWFTAGVVEFIEISGLKGSQKRFLIETLKNQVKALENLQRENGMWNTVLTDATSYEETSATAGFGYGILKAVRKGYIDQKYLAIGERAAKAVISNIGAEGIVQQVSYGTGMGMDANHYKTIPICPTAYGQSLTIMILTEVLNLI
ncbi:MAG: glycoside hydrolase family 88 protein [Clostridiaceae bacterium]|nr:glycoside hydrolase family 88 protein [Clostridiaceae bacterium]